MLAPTSDSAEGDRMAALLRYEILDTPSDGNFDRITSLAARLLDAPIALTSLVDTDRIWFKSRHGLEVDQIDRTPGLCSSAILNSDPYIVENAAIDPRTLSNPLVAGEFGLRFYAAVPLRTHDNHNLGTLCVIDKEPRILAASELETLAVLGKLIMDQMELRLASRKIAQLNHIASRDLKDPLTTVMMFSNILEEKTIGPLNPEQNEMVSSISKSTEVMLKVIRDYLD